MIYRIIAAAAAIIVLNAATACSSSPFASSYTPASEARMEGGTFGSGHITAPPENGGMNASGDPATDGTLIESDTTARGGTFGSGHDTTDGNPIATDSTARGGTFGSGH